MTTDRDTARLVRDWLREPRAEDPDRVLDQVLDRIEWIPQQRRSRWLARRFSIVKDNRFRFGIAAAAVVVAVFLGLRLLPSNVGGPGPEQIPETAFISERHGYVLMFTDDSWEIIEGAGQWAPGTMFDPDTGGVDFADKIGEDQPVVLLTSQPLDVERDEWLERHDRLSAQTYPDCPLASTETRTVDGEEARVAVYDCVDGGDGTEAIMFHRDRVYAVRVFDEEAAYDPGPLRDEFLELFRFAD